MMVRYCVAFGCNETYKKGSAIQFHRFPRNCPKLLKTWENAVRRKNWKSTVHSTLCSKHFTEESYQVRPGALIKRLKEDAVPSVFSFTRSKENARRQLSFKTSEVIENTAEVSVTASTMTSSCFVCDNEVSDEIFLTSTKTVFTKTIFVTKISQVMGDGFMVVAAEEDQLCKRCASLINKSDKLEVDLMKIQNTIKQFLDVKYDLIPKEGNWTESEVEYTKSDNAPGELEIITAHPLIGESKIKTEPKSGLVEENNIKLNEDPCMAPSQNCPSVAKCTEEIKLEHYGGEALYTLISDRIGNKNEMIANEEFNSSLSNENLESNKEKISKTSIKPIKMNSKIQFNETLKIKKKRFILPKLVKSSDILKLASSGVFESINPRCENNQPVYQSVQEQNTNLNNLDSGGTIIEKSNCNIRDQKRNNPLKCDICEKECTTKNRLDMHKKSHEEKICDFCGRPFKSNYRLKVHRNIHTKLKKFTCTVCGKTFIHHSTYWYHCKWHVKPYPFNCEICGKKFKHSSILAIHRRTHTGERPYKCSYCPRTFTVSTTMKKHEMLHTNEYAFNCNVCSKGFTTRCNYVQHMNRAHKINDKGSDVHKQKKKCDRLKSRQKQISPPNVSSNLDLVGVDGSYIPQTFQEEVEVVVGSEGMKKLKDISIEVINQNSSQLTNGDKEVNVDADQVENQFVNTDQNIPIDLGESVVEIVLGPDECVFYEEVIS